VWGAFALALRKREGIYADKNRLRKVLLERRQMHIV